MSDGRPHSANDDVNEVPISPPAPGAQERSRAKRNGPDLIKKGPRQGSGGGGEMFVDTDRDPSATPPGRPEDDEGPDEASAHLDSETGGPTPTLGP
jgi:hypothetical protein